MDKKRVAGYVAMEVPLLTVPMVFPQLPFLLGALSWTGALALGAYATSDYWLPVLRASNNFQSRQGEWIPLHDALHHIACHSQWAHDYNAKSKVDLEKVLQAEFVEACSRGELVARGRIKVSELPNYALANASEEIPREFWAYAFVQPFGEIIQSDAKRGVAATEGKFHNVPRAHYREVVVRAADVTRLWPKVKGRRSKYGLSAFQLAIQAYWDSHSKSPSRLFDDEFDVITAGNITTDA